MTPPEHTGAGEAATAPLRAVEEPDSPRARLRAAREQLRQKRSIDLVVPGYNGLLGVRYRPVRQEEFQRLARRLSNETTALEAALDMMVEACEAILYRDSAEVDFEPLVDDKSGMPLRFGPELADVLGFEAESARETVLGVFSPDGVKDLSPIVHGNALSEWMQGNDEQINRALLGK